MRLYPDEKVALKKAIFDIQGKVYLFGSRLEDNKKGGDIDILILSEGNQLHLSQRVSLKFFQECEEKMDAIVMNPDNLSEENEAFLRVIKKKRIK